MKPLRPFRRLHGLCLYCGQPVRADVCRSCSDLPLHDPLVARARVPLSETELRDASAHRVVAAFEPHNPHLGGNFGRKRRAEERAAELNAWDSSL